MIEHCPLVDAHPRCPTPCLGDLVVRVDVDQVGKGVGLAGGDGRDMVLMRVGERDDLEQRVLERRLACPADFGAFWGGVMSVPNFACPLEKGGRLTRFGPRLRHRHLERPHLPAHLVLAAHGVPVLLAALLLEELHRHLAAAAAAARPGVLVRPVALRLELTGERVGALVDERLDLRLGNVGELEAEYVARLRGDGGEEAEEEDGVEDAWAVASGLANFVPYGGANRPAAAVDMIGKSCHGVCGRLVPVWFWERERFRTSHDVPHRVRISKSLQDELGALLLHHDVPRGVVRRGWEWCSGGSGRGDVSFSPYRCFG